MNKLLVLGCINRRKSAHGYEVYRDLIDWRADTWTCVNPGSIYNAIAKLNKDESIRPLATEHGMRGGSRTKYELTPKGRRLLKENIKEALVSPAMDEFSAGIAFMNVLNDDEAIATLEKRLAAMRGIASFLHTLPTEATPSTPDKHPALVGYWAGLYDYSVAHAEYFLTELKRKRSKTYA